MVRNFYEDKFSAPFQNHCLRVSYRVLLSSVIFSCTTNQVDKQLSMTNTFGQKKTESLKSFNLHRMTDSVLMKRFFQQQAQRICVKLV